MGLIQKPKIDWSIEFRRGSLGTFCPHRERNGLYPLRSDNSVNEGISSVLDRHVLLTKRSITVSPENPWTSSVFFFEIRIGVRTRAMMATNSARGRQAAASEVFAQYKMGYFSCQGKLPGEDDHGVQWACSLNKTVKSFLEKAWPQPISIEWRPWWSRSQ
jgi:hypothetical protein